ncbi:MAG: alpha-glucosidase/alpha-galactosidase [Verrucomicrobiales bacterium]
MAIKISIIGGGSLGFTRRLMQDILSVPELANTHFSLTDISKKNLEMVSKLCRRDIQANGLPATVEITTDRRQSLKDADYVLCTIRHGGLEAFAKDVEIPLRYGVDQCVGDTLCAGGLMYAQRTIPVLLDFCRDIREVAKPDALFLNYVNPMAMNTWACNKYGGVRTIGLCHGVQGGHHQITAAIDFYLKSTGRLPKDYISPGHTPVRRVSDTGLPKGIHLGLHRSEVDIVCAGINHQTWYTDVRYKGEDMLEVVREWMPKLPHLAKTEKVRLDVLARFGYYSTESNGHLSEYLPWYRKRTEEIIKWIDTSSWIHGETGGYLRICKEGRDWFMKDYPQLLKSEPPKISTEKRSEEHASYIIESLETGRPYRGHFNIINQGHITNLPDECCIEIPGYVDGNGINMPIVGALPMACAATCSASVRVQEMGMEAAVHGNVTLLKQAMLHDPLVGAVCNPEEVWQMTDELLIEQAEWLPNYAQEIPAARNRLKAHTRKGTRVLTQKANQGAVRIKTRSPKEMSRNTAQARKLAMASDKGNMTHSS